MSLSTAVVPFREDPLLKRAREEEEDRYNAKRRKITKEEKQVRAIEELKAIIESQSDDYIKAAAKARDDAFFDSGWPKSVELERTIRKRLVMDEYQRRRSQVTLEDEIKRFNTEIERMPLAELDEKAQFSFGESPKPKTTIKNLAYFGRLNGFITENYWHLTYAIASELDSWKRRLNELEQFEEAKEQLEEKDRQREIDAEVARFKRELPTLDLTNWYVDADEKVISYLHEHDYKHLTRPQVFALPEFRSRMRTYTTDNIRTALRDPFYTESILRGLLEDPTGIFPYLGREIEEFLTQDEMLQLVRNEFDRRGYTQRKSEAAPPPDLLRESKDDRKQPGLDYVRYDDSDKDLQMYLQPEIDESIVAKLERHIATRKRGLDEDDG